MPKITQEQADIIESLYNAGNSTKTIANAIKKSQRTVQRYVHDHISEVEGEKWKPVDFGIVRPTNIRNERDEAILQIIGDDCSLTQDQIIDKLPQELKCSKRAIRGSLKRLEVTRKLLRKIPVERNDRDTIKMRKAYALKIYRKPDSNLYFFDETGFNLHNGPRYGYSLRGTTPSLEHPGNRGQNISVNCCIGVNGVVHRELIDGAYNADKICDFLDDVCSLLPSGSTLIMDNARIHKGQAVLQKIDEHGIKHLFLPRYSPQLNPIENFFSILKARQSRIRPRPKDRIELYNSIQSCFDDLMDFQCHNLYRKMREYASMAIASEPFL